MTRLFCFFILLVGFSCSIKEHEHNENNMDSFKTMQTGLRESIKGSWISTEFTDSIFANRRIQPWKNIFYGNLFLTIDESDTVYWKGSMDGGPFHLRVKDDSTFDLVHEFGISSFKYSSSQDMIALGKSKIFKRATSKETTAILMDEERLMKYIINRLFTTDYMSKEMVSRIDYISLGLETYTPFNFDAIRIRDEFGEVEYYGWEFSGDSLILYNTSRTLDENSGFNYFSKADVDTVLRKKH